MRRFSSQAAAYAGIFAASFVLAVVAGWLGTPIDNVAYDWIFRTYQPALQPPECVILAVDEPTLRQPRVGMRGLRRVVADGLTRISAAAPKAVAIDLTLADDGDPADDAALERALAVTKNVVLACDLIENGRAWEHPIARFRKPGTVLGHVHAEPGQDSISRQIALAKATPRERRWALGLEAYRLSLGADAFLESPDDIQVGNVLIPARVADGRLMRIRYRPPGPDGRSSIPQISFKELAGNPAVAERMRGKVVFIGVTAQSAIRDKLMTPYSDGNAMPGAEIHANVFETIAQRQFLLAIPHVELLLLCLALSGAGVAAFAFRSGWQAYVLAILAIGLAHAIPYLAFRHNIVVPYVAPVASAWLAALGAGLFQYGTVRRQLGRTEAEKTRYQQAMHFVTHEMRTPLTAIQGSSELMGRYNLTDEKRKQMAQLINSESKRLAKMIETFLNVERLSAGQMKLKTEDFTAPEIVAACVDRCRPLAERKQIGIVVEAVSEVSIAGDRELMEYAIYNLLTNAVKYSPAETEIRISGRLETGQLKIAVRDQGFGMDQHEVRNIFQKFYRTRSAVASGEAGTGIGLSIVEQIVSHHNGRIEVTSTPGKGSCFTLVLPARMRERVEK